jgi:hypothetical protein
MRRTAGIWLVAREGLSSLTSGKPLGELGEEIVPVLEAAHLEEASLDPADQVLDGPLLVGPPRLAELDAEAKVYRQLGQRLVPDDGRSSWDGRRRSWGYRTRPGGERRR